MNPRRIVTGIVAGIRRRHMERGTVRALSRLDDRMLHDIGITDRAFIRPLAAEMAAAAVAGRGAEAATPIALRSRARAARTAAVADYPEAA